MESVSAKTPYRARLTKFDVTKVNKMKHPRLFGGVILIIRDNPLIFYFLMGVAAYGEPLPQSVLYVHV